MKLILDPIAPGSVMDYRSKKVKILKNFGRFIFNGITIYNQTMCKEESTGDIHVVDRHDLKPLECMNEIPQAI